MSVTDLDAGRLDDVVGLAELQALARRRLSAAALEWVEAGAGRSQTVAANREAFSRWRLVPRALRGQATPDLTCDLLGHRLAAPVVLAPVGALEVLHPDADRGAARAARENELTMVVSGASSVALEELADELGPGRCWFQLYPTRNADLTASLVRRAEAVGCAALVVTVDFPVVGWRHRDRRASIEPVLLSGEGVAMFASDPCFQRLFPDVDVDDARAVGAAAATIFPDPGFDWAALERLRNSTSLPLVVKGVLHANDAELALGCGADAVVISNHGGRQVDGAIATLDALAVTRDRVGDDVPLLLDGGVTSGSDVAKALALGADAVLVGRAWAYALALAGAPGAARTLGHLTEELATTMRLLGVRTPAELRASSCVVAAPA